MFKIALNKIYMTRGDDARFTISLADLPGVQQEYQLSESDDIYFIVTKNPSIVDIEDLDTPGSCLFYKKGLIIDLDPKDTENLEEGSYYYQVRVILSQSDELHTIIEPEDFILTPDRNWW